MNFGEVVFFSFFTTVGWGEMGIGSKMGHIGYTDKWPILPSVPTSTYNSEFVHAIFRFNNDIIKSRR